MSHQIESERIKFFPRAPERHPLMFSVLYDVRDVLTEWLDRAEHDDPKSALGFVRFSTTMRAWNTFKAVVPVLENDHWEDAFILIRSMFELLLTVEHILREPKDAEMRAEHFLLYERLQDYLRTKVQYEYHVHTKRTQSDPQLVARMEVMAVKAFRPFLAPPKKGKHASKVHWAKSWCQMSVYDLAKAGGEMREWQYRILYAYTSAFVHATPMAVGVHFAGFDGRKWEEVIAEQLESNEASLQMAISLLIQFMLDILMRNGEVISNFDPHFVLKILSKIYILYGVVPPDQRDGKPIPQ
jgi:Family of unknown function (DUF5677)